MTLERLRAFVAANYPGLAVHQYAGALAVKHGETVVCFLTGNNWEEGVKARINDGLTGCARKLRKQADLLAGMVRAQNLLYPLSFLFLLHVSRVCNKNKKPGRNKPGRSQPMRQPMPRTWAAASSPDWTYDDCAVCGRKARNARAHVLVDLGDNGTMDTDGAQALPVGPECKKQVPAEYLT